MTTDRHYSAINIQFLFISSCQKESIKSSSSSLVCGPSFTFTPELNKKMSAEFLNSPPLRDKPPPLQALPKPP